MGFAPVWAGTDLVAAVVMIMVRMAVMLVVVLLAVLRVHMFLGALLVLAMAVLMLVMAVTMRVAGAVMPMLLIRMHILGTLHGRMHDHVDDAGYDKSVEPAPQAAVMFAL